MKKNNITFLLTALLSIVGTNGFAHDIEVANADGITIYYKWANNHKELSVSYRGSSYSNYSDEYEGSVVIPESVTYNGKTYPVTTIGDNAFYKCSGLTSVTIPNSVTSIGNSAFWDCLGLTSVTIGNSVTTIGDNAFYKCSGLTSVTIGNSVTTIGGNAFYKCSGLTSVTIGNSVTSIGGSAFQNCSGLTNLTIPNSVMSIGFDAFINCSGLTSIVVESGNTKYDSRENCNAIIEKASNTLIIGCKNTIIPNSVTRIGTSAFSSCSGLISVIIPNSVTTIDSYAFKSCINLTSVTMPNSIKAIYYGTFFNCKNLTNLIIPDSVISIGGSAFYGCSGLTDITIPNSVTKIDGSAFYGCSGLTSITIPNSVTSIGSSAFSGCSGLTSVTCYANNPPTPGSSFDDYTIPLYVPKGSVIKYKAADNWRNFVIIREISDEQDVYLNIRQANGSVRMKVDDEKPYFNLQIKADEGWKIHSVTYNEEDVTAEIASDGSFTTPVINSNAVLNVVFEKGSSGVAVQTESPLRVLAYGNTIQVSGAETGEQIAVYSMDGKLVERVNAERGTATIPLPENQTYIVKGRQKTVKVRL